MLKAGLCCRLTDAAVITWGQKDGICEAASWGGGGLWETTMPCRIVGGAHASVYVGM